MEDRGLNSPSVELKSLQLCDRAGQSVCVCVSVGEDTGNTGLCGLSPLQL